MHLQAFAFKRWADDRTLDAVGRINQEEYAQAYAFACQQLNHMAIVEELFRSRLLAQAAPHASTNTDQVPSLANLRSRLVASNEWYGDYVSQLASTDEEIAFVFADGRPGTMSVEEILFHIITHGSYHRGNIAHALDLAAVPHPIDGYGIYIHGAEPQRRKA